MARVRVVTVQTLLAGIKAGTHRIKRVGTGAPWVEAQINNSWVKVPLHPITLQNLIRRSK